MERTGILTLGITAALIAFLAFTRYNPLYVFLAAVVALVFTGAIGLEEAVMGFSNQGVIAFFLVLTTSQALRHSQWIHRVLQRMFSQSSGYSDFLTKGAAWLAPLSGMVSNTLLMGVSLPYVVEFARRNGLSPSKVLIPFAYLIVGGGTLTLLGTASHLVIKGLMADHAQSIGVFSLFPFGVVAVAVIFIYLRTVGRRLLPDRPDPQQEALRATRQYTVEARVMPESPLIGQTVESAGLRHLEGLFLAEIIRGGRFLRPVHPAERIESDDILVFVGDPNGIAELVRGNLGLRIGEWPADPFSSVDVVEAIVPSNSPLIRRRVRDAQLRSRFDGAVIAIHRQGERLRGKVGDLVLQPGDLLLFLAGPDFFKRTQNDAALYVLNHATRIYNVTGWKDYAMLAVFGAAVAAASLQLISLPMALLGALTAVVAFRWVPFESIFRGMNWALVLMVALSIPIGHAIVKSGLTDQLIHLMAGLLPPVPWVWLVMLYVMGVVLTELTFNVSAGVLMAPLAVQAAQWLGEPPTPFLIVAMLSVALSFITPYGYHVNLMVMGPGNYRYIDYVRVGMPLTVVLIVLLPLSVYAAYWWF